MPAIVWSALRYREPKTLDGYLEKCSHLAARSLLGNQQDELSNCSSVALVFPGSTNPALVLLHLQQSLERSRCGSLICWRSQLGGIALNRI
jgi:hypothetical protein